MLLNVVLSYFVTSLGIFSDIGAFIVLQQTSSRSRAGVILRTDAMLFCIEREIPTPPATLVIAKQRHADNRHRYKRRINTGSNLAQGKHIKSTILKRLNILIKRSKKPERE